MQPLQASTYSLQFLYKIDQLKIATAVCEEERQLSPRGGGGSPGTCIPYTTAAPTTAPPTTAPQSLPRLNGEYLFDLLVCLLDLMLSPLFHFALECTPDRHFVFSIEHDSTSIPVDPTKLVIPGYPDCQPIFVNETVAIFKFPVTKCGSRTYVSPINFLL